MLEQEEPRKEDLGGGQMSVEVIPNEYRSFTLSQSQIDEFIREGVIVLPALLSAQEVADARAGLHTSLLAEGVDVNDLTSKESANGLRILSSTNGSGGVLDMFYEPFKLRIAENPRIWDALSQLWAATYARHDEAFTKDACIDSDASSPRLFRHRFGHFDPRRGFAYIDRVGASHIDDGIDQFINLDYRFSDTNENIRSSWK